MSALDDVRELHEEAGRLEDEATDCRIQAAALVAAGGLCVGPDPHPNYPVGRCCNAPHDCLGRVYGR